MVRDLDELFRDGIRYSWTSGFECETKIIAAGQLRSSDKGGRRG
jgi:hypothetical protein